ncbi:MAG TPA: AraC family transcriptional regulator, partial [Rikenellaceae bacterium]|nr:AraC family transcriptional regulator [Rikenellaceae bacterium]
MGVAMLALGVNYAIHFLTMVRFENAHYAILLNISTYSLCFGLFSIALITLLEPEYFCKRQFFRAVAYWLGFTVLALGVI